MSIEEKILGAQRLLRAGSIRDQYLRNLSTLESDFSEKEEEVRAYEDSAGLTDITCYYASRPRRGNPTHVVLMRMLLQGLQELKLFILVKIGRFFIRCKPRVHVQFQKHAEIAQNCEGLQAELDEINTVIQARKLTRLRLKTLF